MSHAIWKGHLSFGLVNIPVSLYSAEKSNELSFNLLDSKNNSKIKYERVNEQTGKVVPWDAIVKGYEYQEGQYVILTNEDFKNIAGKNLKMIEIEDFIPKESINFIFFETPYYLLPDKKGEKGYALLREILIKTKKIAIGRVMIRSHQHLAAIIPYGDAIILNIVRYAHELKKPTDFELPTQNLSEYKITKKEIEIAQKLVESMTTSWKPEQYKDEYHDSLLKLIEEKTKTGTKVTKKRKPTDVKGTNVVDFMDLLQKSIKQKKKNSHPKPIGPKKSKKSRGK